MADKRKKLSDGQVAEIRGSKLGLLALSKRYQVTPKHIWSIRKGLDRKQS